MVKSVQVGWLPLIMVVWDDLKDGSLANFILKIPFKREPVSETVDPTYSGSFCWSHMFFSETCN